MTTEGRFVFVDIETTGLNNVTDLILEIGVRIVGHDLFLVDEYSVLVWDKLTHAHKLTELRVLANADDKSAKFVLEMHEKSGLWDAARLEGQSYKEAQQGVIDFLNGHGVKSGSFEPMCGSSVHFDRGFFEQQMPEILKSFSHRNIDVSSIKELCKVLSPELYGKLDKYGPPKQEKHRVLDDLEDTCGELRWYIENFLWTEY